MVTDAWRVGYCLAWVPPEGLTPEQHAAFAALEVEDREWHAQAPVRAAAEQERRDRHAREAVERRQAFEAEARAAIRSLVTERAWSIHPSRRAAAVELSDLADLHGRELEAIAIVEACDATVARAQKKMRIVAVDDPLRSRAEDPDVRQAALDACRAISRDDEDWAAQDNRIGWSKTATVPGHVLSGKDVLTVQETVAALRLLRVHQGQVRPDLRDVLFG